MTRALRPLAALGLATLLAAGCSHSPTATTTTGGDGRTAPSTPRDEAVRFAGCMRDNGITEFPDPDASGELTIDGVANGSSLDVGSAAFDQALTACKDLEPAGFTGHRRNAQQQSAALVFARCIRQHGVADFPDPTADAPLIDTRKIPSTDREGGMAILNAAVKTCGDLGRKAMDQ